jgi:hypothetical protein
MALLPSGVNFGDPSQAAVPSGPSSPSTTGVQLPPELQDIFKRILAGAQPHIQGATSPAPVPPGALDRPTLTGKYSGPANLGSAIGGIVQNAVHVDRAKKLAAATSDWNDLLTSTQKYIKPDGSIDEKAYQDPAVMQILGDPKKLKLMAKSLNVDWLNPKPDLYADARNIALKQHSDKQGALQGLKSVFSSMNQRIRGQSQQQQMSPQQQQTMARDVMSRAPVQVTPSDPKQSMELMKGVAEMQTAQANLIKAEAAAREKYDVKPDKDGNLVAVNKSDPTDVVRVTDPNGRAVTSQPKVGLQPKVVSIGGVPYGVARDGKTVTPTDPEWTGQDAKLFEASKGAYAAGEAAKNHRVELAANVRAQAFGKIREYNVIDSRTGQEMTVNSDVINAAPPGTFVGATGGAKIMNAQAIFGEIDYTSGQLKQSIEEMGDTGFDAKTRAQIAAVLRDTDPRTAWNTFLTSEVAGTLTDPQIKYVTSLVSMDESAMSLRSLAGQGQASDSMRNRISAMLPSAGTPSAKYARAQMRLFDGELTQLKKGVPGLGGPASGAEPKAAAPKVGTVEDGYRFNGGNPADKNNWTPVKAQ